MIGADFLGSDRQAHIERIMGLDAAFYAPDQDPAAAFDHFISKGRFDGVPARKFDRQAYLSKYPKLLPTVREKLAKNNQVVSDEEALKAFFAQRKTHTYNDFSDTRAERLFWQKLALEINANIARSYSFSQKKELVSVVGNGAKAELVDYFLEHQEFGLLGSHAALLLAHFSMDLERPLSAEYFLLSYDYGVAWSYPVNIANNACVFPVVKSIDYIAALPESRLEQDGFKVAPVGDAIVLGGSSIMLMPDNRLVNQIIGENNLPLDDVSLVRLSSPKERYAAVDFPQLAARLDDAPYACVLDQRCSEPTFFLNGLSPAALAVKALMPNAGFVFDEDAPRIIGKPLRGTGNSTVRYLAAGASVGIAQLYLLGRKSDAHPEILPINSLRDSETPVQSQNWTRVALRKTPDKLSELLNNEALEAVLEKAGFEQQYIANEESDDTAKVFRESKYIVAFASSALFNIIFCAPGTKILVLVEGDARSVDGFHELAAASGIDLQFFECSKLLKDEGQVSWVDTTTFSAQLASLFDHPPTVNSALDDLASIYRRELLAIPHQTNPNIALRSAINLSGRLVYQTRKKNYMMIDHAYNDAVFGIFENAAAQLLPPAQSRPVSHSPDKKHVCILATQIYATGGHTRLLEDIVETQKDTFEISLILTDFRQMQQPVLRPQIRWPNLRVLRADGPNLEDNVRSVHSLLEQINPDVVINVAHPYDAIAFGFMMSERQRKWLYLVHSDHTFSLIPRPEIADLLVVTEPCGSNFTEQSIPHVKLPLTSEYEEVAAHEPYSSHICEELLTLSVGPQHKFLTKGDMRYSDVLLARFRAAGGHHLHIGDLPDDFMAELNESLETNGFAGRFKCLGFMPSVHNAILELKVDLYIGSYPVGGGKAPVEAMAAGCPISQCDDGRWGNGEPMVYPEALRWKNMKELERSIAQIDQKALIEQRQFARDFYLKNHSRDLFSKELKKAILA